MTAAILKMLPKPRGRQGNVPPMLALYPQRHAEGLSFVYVMAFQGGVLKVGQTRRPRSRLRDHWKRASGEVLWIHLFAAMPKGMALAVERAAPDALKAIARQINNSEWFFGGEDKTTVVGVIRGVVDRLLAEERERHERAQLRQQREARARAILCDAAVLLKQRGYRGILLTGGIGDGSQITQLIDDIVLPAPAKTEQHEQGERLIEPKAAA